MDLELATTQEDAHPQASTLRPRVVPFLCKVLECEELRGGGSRHALEDVAEIRIGRGDRGVTRTVENGRDILTVRVPDPAVAPHHARIVNHAGHFIFEDGGSERGSVVDGASVSVVELFDGALIEVGSTLFLFREAVVPFHVERDKRVDFQAQRLTETLSSSVEESLNRVRRVAASPLSLLFTGEVGTGKQVLAHEVHQLSGRAGRFVAVHSGAIAGNLMEAQLHGYVRGAFPGAVKDSCGILQLADGGTLFLDQVELLTPAAQTALSRALQAGHVRPVGTAQNIPVDIRVIAATHVDLEQCVRDGRFRPDLYALLTGSVHRLSSLHERPEDLGLFFGTLLGRLARGAPMDLRVDAARALFSYGFARNIRELEQCLTTAFSRAGGRQIRPEHLPEAIRSAMPQTSQRRSGVSEQRLAAHRESVPDLQAFG